MNTPRQYQQLFDTMVIHPEKQAQVDAITAKIKANIQRYQTVVIGWDLPWYFVGIIHNMEADLNFTRHLHNGDKLTARTTHVPAGRPITGNPPFAWEYSATDALKLRGLDKITDWSLPHTLLEMELYNGAGYAHKGLPSPYLWSGSNQYIKGKYISDGHFDPEAVSNQIGAALLLKQFV